MSASEHFNEEVLNDFDKFVMSLIENDHHVLDSLLDILHSKRSEFDFYDLDQVLEVGELYVYNFGQYGSTGMVVTISFIPKGEETNIPLLFIKGVPNNPELAANRAVLSKEIEFYTKVLPAVYGYDTGRVTASFPRNTTREPLAPAYIKSSSAGDKYSYVVLSNEEGQPVPVFLSFQSAMRRIGDKEYISKGLSMENYRKIYVEQAEFLDFLKLWGVYLPDDKAANQLVQNNPDGSFSLLSVDFGSYYIAKTELNNALLTNVSTHFQRRRVPLTVGIVPPFERFTNDGTDQTEEERVAEAQMIRDYCFDLEANILLRDILGISSYKSIQNFYLPNLGKFPPGEEIQEFVKMFQRPDSRKLIDATDLEHLPGNVGLFAPEFMPDLIDWITRYCSGNIPEDASYKNMREEFFDILEHFYDADDKDKSIPVNPYPYYPLENQAQAYTATQLEDVGLIRD